MRCDVKIQRENSIAAIYLYVYPRPSHVFLTNTKPVLSDT